MRQLTITQIIIRNFRSIIEETVDFPISAGLNLLTAKNLVEPRLGANGGGKSSLWDAIAWCFYGSSIRETRMSALISWGTTDLEVSIQLVEESGTVNKIRRFGPPMKIELNDKPATQEEINRVIGLSKKSFCSAIIFGQDMDMFPDKSIPERGELLDEVLDLAIWHKATEAASTTYKTFESELASKKVELTFITGKLSSLQTEKQVQAEVDFWDVERTQQIIDLERQEVALMIATEEKLQLIKKQQQDWNKQHELIEADLKQQEEQWKEKIMLEIENKAVEIEALEAEIAPLIFETENEISNPFAAQISILDTQLKLAEVKKTEENKKLLQAEFELKSCLSAEGFWENDVCPTCSRPITEHKKKQELECIERLKQTILQKQSEAQKAFDSISASILVYAQQLQELQSISIRAEEKQKATRKDIIRVQNQVKAIEASARTLLKQYDAAANPFTSQLLTLQRKVNPYIQQEQNLLETKNPYPAQVVQVRAKTNPYKEKLIQVIKERTELEQNHFKIEHEYKTIESKMLAVEYWKHGFKRIRLYFVQQVLTALQLEIQSALSALGLEKWSVYLNTESITKSETVKLGVQINISSPVAQGAWESWSGGEAQRLRLAISLGLAALIQRAAGVIYTQEIYDEPVRSLSVEGIEDLLEALRYRADTLNKQIFITDHSNIQFSGFTEIWTAVKDKNGTKILKT